MEALDVFYSRLEEIDEDNKPIRNYIDDGIITTIENNIDFFNDIPNRDKRVILETFIQIIFDYQFFKHIDFDKEYFAKLDKIKKISTTDSEYFSKVSSTLNKNNQKNKIKLKPSQKIAKVINTIKSYQTMIEETFASRKKDGEYGFLNVSKEIQENYENNKAILKDLENKEFKIVSKYTFYELPNATKTPIKQFLQKIRKQYNLKKSVSEKQLIDELEVHNIYTNEVAK